jgi:hypothetical protein
MNVETGSVPSRITRPSGLRPGTARRHGHVAAEHRQGRAVKWKVGAASGGRPRACAVAGGQGRRDDGLPGNRGVRDAVYWSGIIGNGPFGIDKDSVTNSDLWPHFCGSWVERSIADGIENAVKQQFAPDPTTVVS